MLRRELISGVLSLSLAGCTAVRGTQLRSAPFWTVTRNQARVYLFGFGNAKDKSWLTPQIERAFRESSELWLETRPADAADVPDAASRQAAAEQMETLGRDSNRSLFAALEPRVAARLRAYMVELGISEASIQNMRPWRAYYVLTGAFWSQRKMSYTPFSIEAALAAMARGEGKSVGYEMPSGSAFFQFMAAVSDDAQSQYLEWLLDYLDDFKNGLNTEASAFAWMSGDHQHALRSLDRMRTRMPDLYQVMQVERNAWWARKIQSLLTTRRTCFVAVGQLHVLGPHGIPRLLQGLGIELQVAA